MEQVLKIKLCMVLVSVFKLVSCDIHITEEMEQVGTRIKQMIFRLPMSAFKQLLVCV